MKTSLLFPRHYKKPTINYRKISTEVNPPFIHLFITFYSLCVIYTDQAISLTIRVEIEHFSREGQIFLEVRILIFFPEKVEYRNLLY